MTTHGLKTAPPYYEDVASGAKNFEVRYDDRGFTVGDTLRLREWEDDAYTGRECSREVGYILRGYDKLEDGYVVMGLR